MAFQQPSKKEINKVTTVTTPSGYGSHSSMVLTRYEDGRVLCVDDRGEYMTTVDRLDNGLADPNRNNFIGRKL